MSHGVVIATADRAGDHTMVLGILVLIAAVGGLVYGLVHVVRSRARRTRSGRGPENAGPEA